MVHPVCITDKANIAMKAGSNAGLSPGYDYCATNGFGPAEKEGQT